MGAVKTAMIIIIVIQNAVPLVFFFLLHFTTLYVDQKFYFLLFRNDEKTAQDYKVMGGSVLHLVLALRGGFS